MSVSKEKQLQCNLSLRIWQSVTLPLKTSLLFYYLVLFRSFYPDTVTVLSILMS